MRRYVLPYRRTAVPVLLVVELGAVHAHHSHGGARELRLQLGQVLRTGRRTIARWQSASVSMPNSYEMG